MKSDLSRCHCFPQLRPRTRSKNAGNRADLGNEKLLQTKGTWQFYIVGQKGAIKAKISDVAFLLRYSNGEIRFHQDDRLKVKLYERQIIEGSRTRMEYQIIEVLEYIPFVPVQKAG